jgi:hypothetical protein
MGIFSALKLVKDEPNTLQNQYAPAIMDAPYGISYWGNNGLGVNDVVVDLLSALQVPTVSKCRNLICGVIGGIPLSFIASPLVNH